MFCLISGFTPHFIVHFFAQFTKMTVGSEVVWNGIICHPFAAGKLKKIYKKMKYKIINKSFFGVKFTFAWIDPLIDGLPKKGGGPLESGAGVHFNDLIFKSIFLLNWR